MVEGVFVVVDGGLEVIDVGLDALPVLVPHGLDVLDVVPALQLLGNADLLFQACELRFDLLGDLRHVQLVLHYSINSKMKY